MENSEGVGEAEEAGEGIGEGRDGESTAQHERGFLLLKQSLETMEETMVTGEQGWAMGGRRGLWGMPTVVVTEEEGMSAVAEEGREEDSEAKAELNSDGEEMTKDYDPHVGSLNQKLTAQYEAGQRLQMQPGGGGGSSSSGAGLEQSAERDAGADSRGGADCGDGSGNGGEAEEGRGAGGDEDEGSEGSEDSEQGGTRAEGSRRGAETEGAETGRKGEENQGGAASGRGVKIQRTVSGEGRGVRGHMRHREVRTQAGEREVEGYQGWEGCRETASDRGRGGVSSDNEQGTEWFGKSKRVVSGFTWDSVRKEIR